MGTREEGPGLNRTNKTGRAAALAIADLVAPDELGPEFLIPDSLDLRVPPRVAAAVAQAALDTGLAGLPLDPKEVEARCRDLVYEGTIAL